MSIKEIKKEVCTKINAAINKHYFGSSQKRNDAIFEVIEEYSASQQSQLTQAVELLRRVHQPEFNSNMGIDSEIDNFLKTIEHE